MIIWTLAQLNEASAVLRAGGVIAYPTESVFGLGCDPRNADAVSRIFQLKQRDPDKGFLLIGANEEQFSDFVDWSHLTTSQQMLIRSSWPGPYTWVFPASNHVPKHVVGKHEGIAVRVTAHEIAAELCRSFGGALVSTSANLHGQSAALSVTDVLRQFSGSVLDGVVDTDLGGLAQPSEIRNALTGTTIRAG